MNRFLAILCLLFLSQTLWSASPLFLVMSSQGKEVMATLSAWEKGKQPLFRLVEEAEPVALDFLYARVAGENLPRAPQENALWLDHGDRLSFSKIQVLEDQLLVHSLDVLDAAGKALAVPLLDARLVWWRNPSRELHPIKIREQLLQRAATRDVAILANGEKFEGILESLDSETLVLDGGESKGRFKSQQLAVLSLGSEKPATGSMTGKGVALITTSGDRITLNQPCLKDGFLEGVTSFGKLVRVDLGKVRKITNHLNRAVALQDISSMSLEVKPWFGERVIQRVESCRIGGEILLGDDAHESGLLLPSNASLIIPSGGKYRGLSMTIGLDSRQIGNSKAVVRILADGKMISGPLEVVKGKPQRVFAAVMDAKEIRLQSLAGPGAQIALVDCFLIP